MEKDFEKTLNHLKNAKKVVVVGHIGHDADSIGSIVTMVDLLENLKVPFSAFIHEEAAKEHHIMPHLDKIKVGIDIQNEEFDTLVVLDSGDLSRAGVEDGLKKLKNKPFIINIDHHQNTQFGDINLTDQKSSSTAEILFELYKASDFKPDKYIATTLLCAIAEDTEFLLNDATTERVVAQTAELVSLGGNLQLAIKKTFKQRSLTGLKFMGQMLASLQENKKLGIVNMVISNQDMAKAGVDEDEVGGMSNFLSKNIKGHGIVFVLKETKEGVVLGSFRSQEKNMLPLVKLLGGGGHPKACGFAIEGSMQKNKEGKWKIV